VTIIHARKMRIYPSDEQKHKIDVTLGHCRYIYNKMLERNEKLYKRRGKHLSYYDMQNFLPQMKKYLPWLAEADSQALKHACRQLDTAFQKFFKKLAGHPKFHSRKGRQSYTTTNAFAMAVEVGRVKKNPDPKEITEQVLKLWQTQKMVNNGHDEIRARR